MKTSLFRLPVPLTLLLFLTSTPSTFAYPTPDPNPNAHPNPAPIPSDPVLLESYLDFNHERSTSSSSPLLSLAIPPSSLQKRTLPQQEPLLNAENPPTNPLNCYPLALKSSDIRAVLAALTSNMLRDHPNGIAFPYSAATHSSTSVKISSSTPLAGDIFNASLELSLTPGAKGIHGVKKEQFGALLQRMNRNVGDEKEGGVMGSKSVLDEGVSGGVRFEARLVVYDLGSKRVCGA